MSFFLIHLSAQKESKTRKILFRKCDFFLKEKNPEEKIYKRRVREVYFKNQY